jgi:PKD repeat protein
MKKIIFTIIVIFSLNSCYYDNREDLLGTTTCDTTNVKYASTIAPLLNTIKCNVCHAAPAAAGSNIVLDNYTDLKKSVDNGSLYGSITHDSNFNEMPKNSGKLDSCTIAKFKAWIDAGALNN